MPTTSGRAVYEKPKTETPQMLGGAGGGLATIALGAHLKESGRDRGTRLGLAGEHLVRSRGDGMGVVLPVEPRFVPV
jgi:hypothetical protein